MVAIKEKVVKNLVFELVERITRFVMHLDEIQKQFYLDESNVKDKLEFINSYKKTLFGILQMVINIHNDFCQNSDDRNSDLNFDLLKESLEAINKLHTDWLSILPRPSEPVELARFKRVIYNQIIRLDKKATKQVISISINEQVGEGISLDPLHEYKSSTLASLVVKYNKKFKSNKIKIEDEKLSDVLKLHITIPRIDAANTFRWPSLIHEMAHSLMNNIVFADGSIDNDFLKFCNHDQFILDYFGIQGSKGSIDKLKHWLTECWCDLIACILIGPAFYFSQYLVFLNAPAQDLNKYPLVSFRLYLIEAILSGRFPKKVYSLVEENFIGPCEDLIETLEEKNGPTYDKTIIARLSNYFKKFFKNHFFASGEGISIQGNEVLNTNLQTLVRKYLTIDASVIEYLSSKLNDGLPIPSIKINGQQKQYTETPSFVQEIFLASWISRCESLQPNILQSITNYRENDNFEEFYNTLIEEPIRRHDQAVLKSIQVSEWFDFFNSGKQRTSNFTIFQDKMIDEKINYEGVLVDFEIRELIYSNQLNIIPLMNIEEQIGTTSIDIRLGTSFQLFYPDQYGIVDFTDLESNESLKKLSKRINLDFIEGITIMPGQFILGHSMEYLKLPDFISGNLEGRSSFARLGIEIHMTAGFIDPGFQGVITFEIYNAGSNTVKLYPGMRIGQLRLQYNQTPEIPYSERHTVKYKGLLEHNVSRQIKDYEVGLIRKEKARSKNVK